MLNTLNSSVFSVAELARASRLAPRTIRHYTRLGLLPKPPFRGPATVYSLDHLMALRAIIELKAKGFGLDRIRAELQRKASAAATAATLSATVESAPVATESDPAEATEARSALSTGARSPDPIEDRIDLPVAHWERIALLPGLELHIAADAAPLARRVAQEVFQRYGAFGEGVGKR